LAQVSFPDSLLPLTNGEREVDIVADNYRDLVAALNARFPGMADAVGDMAVAIDGQIYQDAFLEPLQRASEVFFMQRIEGG